MLHLLLFSLYVKLKLMDHMFTRGRQDRPRGLHRNRFRSFIDFSSRLIICSFLPSFFYLFFPSFLLSSLLSSLPSFPFRAGDKDGRESIKKVSLERLGRFCSDNPKEEELK